MKLSPKKRVLKALMGGKTDRAPVTSITGCGGSVNVDMQTATGIFWPEAHKGPELMAKLAIAGYEIGGIECVKIPFHNITEAEALGCKTRYPKQRHLYPVVVENPYNTPQDLKMPDRIVESGRLPIVLQAIRIAREFVGDFLPISSHVVGPFTLACELVGIERFSIWSLKNIDYVRTVTFAYANVFVIAESSNRVQPPTTSSILPILHISRTIETADLSWECKHLQCSVRIVVVLKWVYVRKY
jgi:[methyl-Co(III) methanol-specific corrinoid protein]:coenzyme M methyltransferase